MWDHGSVWNIFFYLSGRACWDSLLPYEAITQSACLWISKYFNLIPIFNICLLSLWKFTSPCARCSFFTRGIKIINNSSPLLVSHLWIIHHTIPAGCCLLLIFLIPLFCWGGGNLVPYLQNRSRSISYLVSLFVSWTDNWIHFLGGIGAGRMVQDWVCSNINSSCMYLHVCIQKWIPSSFFPLKVTFWSSITDALKIIGWTHTYTQKNL